ncbi:CHY zinc finger protein [Streptococcaceae bacterium ESL0687]|nr:CHY zinc finger protein [Streptococcaceae bacterium ESL0687]
METVYGLKLQANGGCIHYNSDLDIIANRCNECKKLYACYLCHDSLENHKFKGFPYEDQTLSVMCCLCGQTYSYKEYSKLVKCQSCQSAFNPKCSLHKDIYTHK